MQKKFEEDPFIRKLKNLPKTIVSYLDDALGMKPSLPDIARSPEAIQLLKKYGINLNSTNSLRFPPTHWRAFRLISHMNSFKSNPDFHRKISLNDREVFWALVDAGADINTKVFRSPKLEKDMNVKEILEYKLTEAKNCLKSFFNNQSNSNSVIKYQKNYLPKTQNEVTSRENLLHEFLNYEATGKIPEDMQKILHK